MNRSMRTLILALVLATLASGCARWSEKLRLDDRKKLGEQVMAYKMIQNARLEAAMQNATAAPILQEAEKYYAEGEALRKKCKNKDARNAYNRAYKQAEAAWKIVMAEKRRQQAAAGCSDNSMCAYNQDCPGANLAEPQVHLQEGVIYNQPTYPWYWDNEGHCFSYYVLDPETQIYEQKWQCLTQNWIDRHPEYKWENQWRNDKPVPWCAGTWVYTEGDLRGGVCHGLRP